MFFKNKELEAENARLKKELAAFLTVQDELREEMLHIALNPQGQITDINDGFSTVSGYGLPQLQGKSLSSLIPQHLTQHDGVKRMLKAIKDGDHWHGMMNFLHANGEELWFRGILQPIEGQKDNVIQFAIYMAEQTKDITKSHEMKDMLAALHNASAVIEFDLHGNILKANHNFLSTMGYSESQIVGKHHRIFCSAEDAESPEYKRFWQDLSQGKMYSDRFKRVDSRGNEVWLEASYNPIRDEYGKLYKVVKFATVITEQMQREFAISEAANVAFSISKETGEHAKNGNQVLDNTVRIMGELTEETGKASSGIKELDEQSQKVADLVQSISGIADQTNLLALNAAIEAARAGDQGRGFAVVADEVRQLASRTSSATEEIVNVVVENRKLTENAVQLIEAGQEKAREALEYSTESGKVMSDIEKGATEVVNAIGQFTQRL